MSELAVEVKQPETELEPLHVRSESGGASSAASPTVKVFFSVSGMTCAGCSGTVENSIRGIHGVSAAKVSLLTERAEVVLDPTKVSSQTIIDEIQAIGFDASLMANINKNEAKYVTERRLGPGVDNFIKEELLAQEGITDVQVTYDSNHKSHIIRATFNTDTTGNRDIVGKLKGLGISIRTVLTEGDMESRKAVLSDKREAELRKWRNSFWLSMLFTIPAFIITMVFPMIPVMHDYFEQTIYSGIRRGSLTTWILVTPVQFGVGMRFYIATYKSIKHGAASMDVLVCLGSSAAYFYSLIMLILATINPSFRGTFFFETSAILISIILLGRYLEHIAKGKTSEALSVLMGLQPRTATIVHVNPQNSSEVLHEENVDAQLVQRGDILKVLRGSTIPVDGIIVEGSTLVDESIITGESMPVRKKVGNQVIGATVNVDRTIKVKATGVGSDTVLAKIVKLVEDAQTNKAPIQAFADNIAKVFVPVVLVLALLTCLVWYLLLETGIAPGEWRTQHTGNFLFSFLFAIAVLVISCPCSLGLATPTAVMVGTGIGAKLGILFKGGEPLEVTGKCTSVLFDKTGTLTVGKPAVIEDETVTNEAALGMTKERLWTLIAACESQSEHLLAFAIRRYATRVIRKEHMLVDEDSQQLVHALSLPETRNFLPKSGAGVSGVVLESKVAIGNRGWMTDNSITWTHEAEAAMTAIESKGHTAVAVAIDDKIGAIISIADPPKPEAAHVVNYLQQQGIKVHMVTGDHLQTARAIAERINIPPSKVHAEVTPSGKAAVVAKIQAQLTESGQKEIVLFVGDGINDSPALAKADVGVAIGAGTDIAVETATVVLMRNNLTDALSAIDLSRHTIRRIIWNFRWAFLYNIIAIPLAAGVFFPFIHMTLPPAVAAAAMGFSSVSVILSSLWLKTYKKPSYDWEFMEATTPSSIASKWFGSKKYDTIGGANSNTALEVEEVDETFTIDDLVEVD